MFEIIPAIDVMGGKCVRLTQGDFSHNKIYSDRPLTVARLFESAGLRRLHVVDLDGARSGKVTNLEVLESISRGTDLVIDFGGGIKTDDDVRAVFDAGAALASIGSIAVKEPARFASWIALHGAEKFILGADVRDGRISINGWQTSTTTEIVPFLASNAQNGVRRVFVTDITKDGMLEGPSTALYRRIIDEVPAIGLIASGGVADLDDIDELERIGCAGVIIGKAIYEGNIPLERLTQYVS